MLADDIIQNSKISMFLAILILVTCTHAQISFKVLININ